MNPLKLSKHVALLFCFAVTVYLTGCTNSDEDKLNPNFESVGLNGRIIYRLEFVNNSLQAATDRGIYRLSSQDNRWYLLGGLNARIVDWANLGRGHWLVSVADGDDYEVITSYAFYESLNDGASWRKIAPVFRDPSSPADEQDPILRMLVLGDVVYATGWGVVAKSSDDGRTWSKVSGDWQTFANGLRAIAYSSEQNAIWYGGQGGFENIVLGKVNLPDADEQFLGSLDEFLPSPSVTKAIRFDPFDADRVFVAAEGGIVQSNDGGDSWAPFLLNNNYRFHFDLIADPQQRGRFYTAGWSKIIDEPQSFILNVTSDNGATWRHYRHPSQSLYGGVYSMTSRLENGKRVVYAGLFKGGVLRISDIP